MREEILSIGVLASAEIDEAADTVESNSPLTVGSPRRGWDSKNFAQQQIQCLVRQLFFARAQSTVRQVVFTAVEPETEVRAVCMQVAEELAQQTSARIAIAGCTGDLKWFEFGMEANSASTALLRESATRVTANVWRVPSPCNQRDTTASSPLYLSQLRREFDYSILEMPAADSPKAMSIAEFADGIILVLSAERTRRAAARKLMESLEAVRAKILGTVLSDRSFPIPDAIYRIL